jgi:1-deoxy-D-xylulose-5-phosphate reductoisomerase
LSADCAASRAPLIVLGATGSIGEQTLDVAARLGRDVAGLAARTASDSLFRLADAWPAARIVATEPGGAAAAMRERLGARVAFGADAMVELAATPDSIIVNGVVGVAGLGATVAALEAGNRLALANKESLVSGGPVVLDALRRGGGELAPVDSEHSAIAECLAGEELASVSRLILTASGGPFRGKTASDLAGVGVADALAHPTWDMGPRITIDSATLMNKAFEVIEAHYLFDVPYDRIDVVVHPQSIVHSLVEFVDGSVKAQLGDPDMRHPIQYAVLGGERAVAPPTGFDLTRRDLSFERPDRETFPCLDLGYAAGRRGGIAPAVLNAADEIAVAAFLDGHIPFLAIADVVAATLEAVGDATPATVADVLETDAIARTLAAEQVASTRR